MEVKIYGTSDEVKDFLKNEYHKANFVTDISDGAEKIYDCEIDIFYDEYPTVTFTATVIQADEDGLIVQFVGKVKKSCTLHIRTSKPFYFSNGKKIVVKAMIVPKRFNKFGCALVADSIVTAD